MVIEDKNKLKEYIDIVQKVAKVEQHRIPNHMVEYEELVSIGVIAVHVLIKDKSPEQLEKYNAAYIATAVRWAIRNELRIRYKWYSMKHKDEDLSDADSNDSANNDGLDSEEIQKTKVRESIYETILSIDGLAAAASDNDSPFDFVKDNHSMPDENAEIAEMSRLIKEAIAKLPAKERTVVEYRFYRNMQVKDIATQIGLSSSRVTRIVQASLNTVKDCFNSKCLQGY